MQKRNHKKIRPSQQKFRAGGMASISSLREIYEKLFEPKKQFDQFCGSESSFEEDAVTGAIKQFVRIFRSGAVKGDTILKIGIPHFIHLLLPACDYFKEIIVADMFDKSLEEVRKWVKKEPGAIDITAAAKFISELQGDREQWLESEEKLRSLITQIIQCDVTEKNPLSPLTLPPVDCVFLTHCLEGVCIDRKTYCSALKNIATLLKTGGHLILAVCLECTFHMSGNFKCPSLYVTENFLKIALSDAGFIIEEMIISPRAEENTFSATDFTATAFIVARNQL